MPAIQVARTDTFEIQRQKINQIGDQIFSISQGGSDLATGNLKLGDGTKSSPSLSFTSESYLGLYKSDVSSITFVAEQKKLSSITPNSLLSYRDLFFEKNVLQTSGISVSNSGQNYDIGTYTDIPFFGGTGRDASFNAEVTEFIGSITNSGSNYLGGSYSNVPLYGGTGVSADTIVSFDVDGVNGNIVNSGSGYIPGTYQNIPLTGGSGNGATANITITGNVIINGTISNQGSGYTPGSYPGISLLNTATQTFIVTTIANPGATPPDNVYVIDGNTQGTFTIVPGNTYRFDVSDSTNSGHPLDFQQTSGNFLPTEDYVLVRRGVEGAAESIVDLIVKPSASTGTIRYYCQNHPNMGADITVSTGSVGSYGSGLTADVTVNSNGNISNIDIVSSGNDYLENNVLRLPYLTDVGGTGSNFLYTLSLPTYQGIVSLITVVSDGQGYINGDLLSIDENDVGGYGSSFQFFVNTDPGTIKNLVFFSKGKGYTVGDILTFPTGVSGISGSLKGSVFNLSSTLSTASPIVTVSSTSGLVAGMEVSVDITSVGQLAIGTTIQSVDSQTQITLSANPTANGSANLSFSSPGNLNDVVVSDASNINIGNRVSVTSGSGVLPPGTTVQNVDTQTNTITLSNNPTLAGSVVLEFSPSYGSPTTPFEYTISTINSIVNVSVNNPGNGYEIGDLLSVVPTNLTKPETYFVFTKETQLVTFVETIADSYFSVGDFIEFSTGISTVQEEIYQVNVSGGNLVSLLVNDSSLTTALSVNKAGQGTTFTTNTVDDGFKFFIDTGNGQELTPDITLYSGNKYAFDYSDSSNSNHRFTLSTFRDGVWSPSLVENVSSNLSTSLQITVSSTTGILVGMEVFVTSGNGSILIGTVVESVDSPTQITLSNSPTLGGQSILSFRGVQYTDSVVREGSTLTITVSDTTPNLYYYCSSHPNVGGDDNNEALLTIDLNNPKVFGSGFEVTVNEILQTNTVEIGIVDGTIKSVELNTENCNVNTLDAITSVNTNSIVGSTLQINSISSSQNLSIDSTNTTISSGNFNVSDKLTIAQSGNLTTAGNLKTTAILNVNDQIRLSGNIISTTTGNDLDIVPASGNLVKITSSSALVLPKGSTLERPNISNATDGAIRFNTSTGQYEGYNSSTTSWSSLGGVRDIDGNTYILAELTAGANDNTLWFYNDNVNTLRLTSQFLDFRSVKKISSGRLGLPTFTVWSSNTVVVAGQYVKYRNNLYEVTSTGTTATSGNEPTHTSGVANNGTAQLTWYSSAVSPLEFTEVEELRVAPNRDAPLIVNQSIKIGGKEPEEWNTISTLVEDLVLAPNSGKKVTIAATSSLVIPVGNTNQRESASQGSIRYNTTISQFEGYSGNNWSSLGGVRDVDGNTYIIPETAPAANENILYFYNDNVNTLQVTTTELDFTNLDTITTSGGNSLALNTEIVTLDNSATTIDNTDSTSSFISTTKQYLDLGLSSGLNVDPVLRLDDQGDVYLNTGFGTGTFAGVKIFDGDLKDFELADYLVKTSVLSLQKGVSNSGAVVLYNTSFAKGCRVTIVSKSSVGKKSMVEYNVIDNGTDVFHNEFGSLNTSADGFTALFDITPGNETRITLTLSDDHATNDTVEITVLTQVIK